MGQDRRFAPRVGTPAVLPRLDMVLVVAVTQIYVLAGGRVRSAGEASSGGDASL